MITAVVVDNGEPLLEKCLESLRDQTERVQIIVVGGDKTDYELARSIADEVYGPITTSIGDARVYGILKSNNEFILSCDSDTIYFPDYAEHALRALQRYRFVKAGTIHPYKPSLLGWLEIKYAYPVIPYEHTLAFRKSTFMREGLHEINFSINREDIAVHMMRKLISVVPIKEMKLITRVPTRWVQVTMTLAPPIVVSSIPVGLLSFEIAKTFLKI